MTMQATRVPTSGAWFSNADDNLKLTTADPCHALIRAIIARAYWDSIGRVGTSSSMTDARQYEIMQDAVAFFEGGYCKHLLESIGCDPEKLGALGLG